MSLLAGLIVLSMRSSAPKIDISTPEFAAHYCALRYYATNPESKAPDGFADGVKAIREQDESLPDTITLRSGERKAKSKDDRRIRDLYWSLLDSQVLSCSSLDELKQRSAMMPAKMGGSLETKPTFEKLVAALETTRNAARTVWPSQKETVAKRLKEWETGAVPRLDQVYDFLGESLGVQKMLPRIRVIVAPLLAGKGGITLRTMDGPLVVVGCNRFEGFDFDEVLIHETIHALDSVEGNVGLFAAYRRDLAAAGFDSPTVELFVHTAIFMHAAEAVRRCIDIGHKDVGETFEIYSRGMSRYVEASKAPLQNLWDKTIKIEAVPRAVAARFLI